MNGWGIEAGYHSVDGRWVPANPETVARIREAMGAVGEQPAPAPVRLMAPGRDSRLDQPHEVLTEAGDTIVVKRRLPGTLPFGYHTLRRLSDGVESRLIVSPGRCYLPRRLRGWGWAVQLYAVRSRRSWGIGDLADLRRLARWSRRGLGARVLLLNPLHAALPTKPQEASPYYPSSRRYRNPLYLRVQNGELAAAARALNRDRLIDRDQIYDLKMAALERRFERFGGSRGFLRYAEREGKDLQDYATFCALSERHDGTWRSWPEGLRHPASAEVGRFSARHARRIRFHQWLQWQLEEDLKRAAAEIEIIHDLAIGVHGDGADAWVWQDCLAAGMTVGAPPDPFNSAGQDWALPPFDPWRLRSAGYEPYIKTLRAALRHAAGLRIDHVMGLFRLYWIPAGAGPGDGAYVRYPHEDLLDILALESFRAGCFVVGEDLGTVEEQVRHEMGRRKMLSYRLLWFEEGPPSGYPGDAMAALTTHDLPTVAGIWEGSDGDEGVRVRLLRHAGGREGMTTEAIAEAAYKTLAGSPARIVTATLEDALGVSERPNRPGTTSGWPNWSLALPFPLEKLEHEDRVWRLAEALQR